MGTLSAIGRAMPSRTVGAGMETISALRTGGTRRALLGMETQRIKSEIARQNREEQERIAEYEKGQTPVAIETLAHRFEGGEDGPMFKMVYDAATKAGLVDKSAGGLGTIKYEDTLPNGNVARILSDPFFLSKLSRTRIDYWRGNLNQVNQALKEKPEDQKLLAQREQFMVGLNQAMGQDKAMTAHIEQEAEARKQAEVERHNLATERIERIKTRTTGKGKPTDFENIYQELKLIPGNEDLTRLDVKKTLGKKELTEVAVGLAQRNIDVISGAATLEDKATEILTILNKLGGGVESKTKPTRKEAAKFLKDNGMPTTEANIKYFMENH